MSKSVAGHIFFELRCVSMWGSSGNFLSRLPVPEKVPYVLTPCRNTTLFSDVRTSWGRYRPGSGWKQTWVLFPQQMTCPWGLCLWNVLCSHICFSEPASSRSPVPQCLQEPPTTQMSPPWLVGTVRQWGGMGELLEVGPHGMALGHWGKWSQRSPMTLHSNRTNGQRSI